MKGRYSRFLRSFRGETKQPAGPKGGRNRLLGVTWGAQMGGEPTVLCQWAKG